MSETDNKPWYASRGVLGGLVAALAGLASLFGYAVAPADQAALTELAVGVAAAGGGLLAIIGRVLATKAIGKAS
jgi:hypothetical protein